MRQPILQENGTIKTSASVRTQPSPKKQQLTLCCFSLFINIHMLRAMGRCKVFAFWLMVHTQGGGDPYVPMSMFLPVLCTCISWDLYRCAQERATLCAFYSHACLCCQGLCLSRGHPRSHHLPWLCEWSLTLGKHTASSVGVLCPRCPRRQGVWPWNQNPVLVTCGRSRPAETRWISKLYFISEPSGVLLL